MARTLFQSEGLEGQTEISTAGKTVKARNIALMRSPSTRKMRTRRRRKWERDSIWGAVIRNRSTVEDG